MNNQPSGIDPQGPDFGPILDRLLQPVRSIRTVVSAWWNGQPRAVNETMEKTVISESGSIDTIKGQMLHKADCGHYLQGSPAGQCGSCGRLACPACLTGKCNCSGCGILLCPACRSLDPATGEVLCPGCADRVAYSRRVRAVLASVGSFFIDPGNPKHD